ncbi:trichohyalin-like isoform X2 [Serinus canaria]|nr:trichohyalin-like isoform X2 [Serinus canaria]
MTRKRVEAELQAELQGARREVQAVQRRHKEDLQGLKEEMNLLLEQREALQKQVGELTSQLAASRQCQENTVQRAQQDGREAQEESRKKLLEIEGIQKLLEEEKKRKKELQVHLQNLDREWSHWEEVAQQNSELQASVNALEREKNRLLLSLEEKNQCLRTLAEQNLALKNRVSRLFSALKQAEQLCTQQRREVQEVNDQVQASLLAEIEKRDHQASHEKQLLETEVSELRRRLQCSEKRAEAMATQCKAVVLELRKTQAQRDNLRAHNQDLQKQMEEDMQEWFKAEARHISRQIVLEKEATERQEEAVTLRQEVESLKRKLEDLEKERKDVLHGRALYQQQMRDLEKKNEIHGLNIQSQQERTQQLGSEKETMQEELKHGAAALKKGRGNTLSAALTKFKIAKGALQKRLAFLKGKSRIQPGFDTDLHSPAASLNYSRDVSHGEVSQEQESSSWSLEQLSQESSDQGHEVAQVWQEEELLGQKADLEGRLAATERLRQDLARQLAETSSAKESLQSRLFAAQQQVAHLEMTRKRVEAELQAELQGARREVQAVQRRHKEDLQGLKEEMNLLLEQREALQKQVGELTSQLAASRQCQENTVQRAQQDGREAQEESRKKLLEIEHIQKLLEEEKKRKKELQVHLQNLDKEWSHWEEVAQQNSELQASVNALELEKARLLLSLEEKNQCLRTLAEQNLALKNRVSRLFSALKQAELLRSQQRRELQERNDQVQASLLAEIEKRDHQASHEKQLLETEVSELRRRLQCSEKRAEAMATQCKAVVLELRKTQAQRDNLRAHNQDLQKQMEEDMQEWFKAEARHISRQIVLEKEATERQEEAVTLRQEVESLKRKLEDLEKERKDVLHGRALYQQQMRDLEKKNEIHGLNIQSQQERTQQLGSEKETMQEELKHGAAALKKGRGNTLSAALTKFKIAKGALQKRLAFLKGKSRIQPGFDTDLHSPAASLNYSRDVSHGEVSQEQESSSWSLEQLSQESSDQGHEVAQVWQEEELLGQKADLEGRLAATERLRQDLARQLAETSSAKESLQSRLFAAQQQVAHLEMTRKRVEAELQAELQGARREVQAVQRRHKEDLQGLKEEMNLLLEQREALQKQVGELTSQLAASRQCQENTVQRAQQDGREAQEESRKKLLEIEHIQKLLEEEKKRKKELQVHLQNLDKEWSHWEEVAQQNSELQASVNALELEKARLLLSLEEKNQCLRTLAEQNLALKNRVSRLFSALKQAEQLRSQQRRELQERNDQVSFAVASSSPGTHNSTFGLEAPTSFPPPSSIHSYPVLLGAAAAS